MKKLYLYLTCIMLVLIMLLSGCMIPNYFTSSETMEKGNVSFDEGNYEEAITYYEEAIKENVFNATAYGNKSAVLTALGKYDEALKAIDKALELAPKTGMLHLNKGDALNGMGSYEEAIKSFDKAISFDTSLIDAYNNKGKAFYYLGRFEEAIQEFDNAIELDSDYVNAYLWKAQIYIDQGKLEEALDACERGIARNKRDPEGYNKKAHILLKMKKYDEAIAVLEKAIALDKSFIDSYIGKISMLYELKDYEGCISFGLETLKRFPKNENIYWYIADSYSAQYMHDKALEYYLETLNSNSQNDQAAAYAGWEYFYLEDYANSEKYANKAIELYSENNDAKDLQKELKKTKLPEAERIVDFVRSNYLYYSEIKGFDEASKEFIKDKEVTAADIAKYVDSIRKKEDIFTFVISGEEYDYIEQEELTTQVSSYELDETNYYIRINVFTPSVGYDFRKALKKIKNTEKKNLIIDLRGNSGGLIKASNDILDYLLPECTTSYTIYRNGYIDSYYSDDSQVKFNKVLVLVDQNSASSSELLTLGLKKYLNNVVVIGKPTFGKGVGQNVYENKSKKYMIFLVSFYWNVREENIAGGRIYPDVNVKNNSNEEYTNAIRTQVK